MNGHEHTTPAPEPAVSKADFARRIGRSKSQVSRYVQAGMPVRDDGLVPVESALAWIKENVATDGDDGGDTLASKKAEKLAVEIERAQLALERERGQVVDRKRAERLVHDLARAERDAWQNWPARIAPEMAADLGADPHTVQTALEKYVRKHLAELSDISPNLGSS